jgi:uncharacterized protein involved in exopolysaccharide biosynthesis
MSQVEDRSPAAPQQADPQPETLDLGAYLRPVLRWKWLILAIAIAAAAGTYALTAREPKTYVTSTLLYVTNANPGAVSPG